MRPIQVKIPPPPKTERFYRLEQAFVEVVLGRQSASCKHFGICNIEIVYAKRRHGAASNFCAVAKSLFALASLKKGLYFEILKSYLKNRYQLIKICVWWYRI